MLTDLVEYGARNADFGGSGERLQPGRNVDPVTEKIIAVDNDIAQVDADAEEHSAMLGYVAIAIIDVLLNGNSAAHRLHGATKLGDYAVASTSEDPAMMAGNERVYGFPVNSKLFDRSFLIRLYKTAVTDNVGDQDSGEAALHAYSPSARSLYAKGPEIQMGDVPSHVEKLG